MAQEKFDNNYHQNSSLRSKVNDLFNPYNFNAKPFLKWAGGKTQLINVFRSFYPEALTEGNITDYFEPFLGSGAVFFDIAQKYSIQRAYLYDINKDLILTYLVIQQRVGILIEFLKVIEKEYLKLDDSQRTSYYYRQRDNFNSQKAQMDYSQFSDNWIHRAALFIFLNRTCYNGLYRVNSEGNFNSPVGKYKNPSICDEDNLLAVSKVLAIAELKMGDFSTILSDLKNKNSSFVYFDPPYRPISKTSNFTNYNGNRFDDKQQKLLSAVFSALDKSGVFVMLSNSDPKNTNPNDTFFDDLYKDYNIFRVPAKRIINSVASKRGLINEIIVTNYQNSQWKKALKEIKQVMF